ncbi:MAG: hypothetical protein ABI479_11930 [Gallionella sp.]
MAELDNDLTFCMGKAAYSKGENKHNRGTKLHGHLFRKGLWWFVAVQLMLREQINHRVAWRQNIQETGCEYHKQEIAGIPDRPHVGLTEAAENQ